MYTDTEANPSLDILEPEVGSLPHVVSDEEYSDSSDDEFDDAQTKNSKILLTSIDHVTLTFLSDSTVQQLVLCTSSVQSNPPHQIPRLRAHVESSQNLGTRLEPHQGTEGAMRKAASHFKRSLPTLASQSTTKSTVLVNKKATVSKSSCDIVLLSVSVTDNSIP